MKNNNIGKYIAAIHRNSQSIINNKLRDYDIRSGQHDFLYVISNNEGINQKELSKKLNIGKATTAKAIKNLLKSGYIRRETNQNDKRFYELYLTEKGIEIKQTINNTFEEMLEIYSTGFTEEEYYKISESLSIVLDNVMQTKNKIK